MVSRYTSWFGEDSLGAYMCCWSRSPACCEVCMDFQFAVVPVHVRWRCPAWTLFGHRILCTAQINSTRFSHCVLLQHWSLHECDVSWHQHIAPMQDVSGILQNHQRWEAKPPAIGRSSGSIEWGQMARCEMYLGISSWDTLPTEGTPLFFRSTSRIVSPRQERASSITRPSTTNCPLINNLWLFPGRRWHWRGGGWSLFWFAGSGQDVA